jgi:hypothetical protein
MTVMRLEQNQEFLKESHFLGGQLEVVLTGIGSTQSICCRDNTKITSITEDIVSEHMLTETILLI